MKGVEVNSNTILLRCLKIGISLLELDNITIGFILDLIDENNREVEQADEPVVASTDIMYKFFK